MVQRSRNEIDVAALAAARAPSGLNCSFIFDRINKIDLIYCFLGFSRSAGERGKENPEDPVNPV